METTKEKPMAAVIRTFKIGALTWGGGYVIIPLLKRNLRINAAI